MDSLSPKINGRQRTITCAHCGETVTTTFRLKKKFCSRECGNAYRHARQSLTHAQAVAIVWEYVRRNRAHAERRMQRLQSRRENGPALQTTSNSPRTLAATGANGA